MEQAVLQTPPHQVTYIDFEESSTSKPFLQANTEEFPLVHIRKDHTIPCFAKDNEPLISHCDFIELTSQVAGEVFTQESILSPSIRLSHPIKGRIPEAKEKAAKDLPDHEKTLYYERMAFIIEIPSISVPSKGITSPLPWEGLKPTTWRTYIPRKALMSISKFLLAFKTRCVQTYVSGQMATCQI